MNAMNYEGTKITYEGQELILDETPYFNKNHVEDVFTADCHDNNGKEYTLTWDAKEKYDEIGDFDSYYFDLNNPIKLEEHISYELFGGWFGVSDRWNEDANGKEELMWVLDKLDNNGATITDKIVIHSTSIPDYFKSFFRSYYDWNEEERGDKIILTAPGFKTHYEVTYVSDDGNKDRELGRYDHKDVAVKAAIRAALADAPEGIKYVDIDVWDGADARNHDDAEFDENIIRLQVGVTYTTPYDDIDTLIKNNKIEFVQVTEGEKDYLSLDEIDKEKLLETRNTDVHWVITQEYPGEKYYIGDDKTVTENKWSGKTLKLIVPRNQFLKTIKTPEDFVINRMRYYKMKEICELAGLGYDRFRNWKSSKVKLSETEFENLKAAMQKVAKDQ